MALVTVPKYRKLTTTYKHVDEKLIERKRQDTMDMCRIFTEETEKLQKINHKNGGRKMNFKNVRTHQRAKRELSMKVMNPMLNLDDAQRVETIVDKLYDDLLEQGEKVNYRRVDIQALERNGSISTKMSGRRFDFAPHLIEGPKAQSVPHPINNGPPPPSKTPRFKLSIVPYFINRKTYDSQLAEIIVKAFDYFERATCIRLQRLHERPTDKESLQKVEWLYITNPTGIRQCVHSNERTLVKGVQMVVFGYDCMSVGDIIHELMHVLGFSHEHTRPDRDKYISILWDNIKPGYKKYFELLDKPNIENMPYDYASILHYPPRAFSKNGQVTIMTEPGIKIGQREGLSEIDIEKVSMLYSAECVKRNRQYLLKTCPSVVRTTPAPVKSTKEDIDKYYESRLWAYGIINYKLNDDMEFTHDEKENILAVIRHIETETCIEFRDLTPELNAKESDSSNNSGEKYHHMKKENSEENKTDIVTISNGDNNKKNFDDKGSYGSSNKSPGSKTSKEEASVETGDKVDPIPTDKASSAASNAEVSDNEIKEDKKSNEEFDTSTKVSLNESERLRGQFNGVPHLKRNMRSKKYSSVKDRNTKQKKSFLKIPKTYERLRKKPASPISPSRRHATNILVFTRSSKPGCDCPKTPGLPGKAQIIEINADCFNSVNILLHLFVHILGLDHQHNSHDRDSYLHIVWDQLTDDVKREMKQKLPPAASAGFAYDYQSVMHYPWLQIKDGRTNIMYPIWNDGWAMGNWQGLSSVDVQKLNLLYEKQCSLRRQEAEAAGMKLRSSLK